MFAIVEFPLSKEVEPVPRSWISKDGQCWWPKYKSLTKIRRAIIRQEVPSVDNYTSYPARILKYYGTYDAAASDLPRAQFDSDLNSEPDTTPKIRNMRVRVPKRTIEMSMSSDEDDASNSVAAMPPPPMPPSPPPPMLSSPPSIYSLLPETRNENWKNDSQCTDFTLRPPVGPSHVLGLISMDNPGTSSIETLLQSPSVAVTPVGNGESSTARNADGVGQLSNSYTDNTMSTANFQAWVVRHMGILKAQVSQLQESVDVLIHGQKATCTDHQNVESEELPSLPIRSMDELTSLNEVLSDDVKRKAMVIKLARRGGQTLGDCVRKILQVLLTNEFATKFNWIGSRGDKMGFKNTHLMHIVYDAARSNRRLDNADEKLMENAVKDWLKNAKKRSDKDNLRHLPEGNQ